MYARADGIMGEQREECRGEGPDQHQAQAEPESPPSGTTSRDRERPHHSDREQAAQHEVEVHQPRPRAGAPVVALGVVQDRELRTEGYQRGVDADVQGDADEYECSESRPAPE